MAVQEIQFDVGVIGPISIVHGHIIQKFFTRDT